jgi:hypothetical protein
MDLIFKKIIIKNKWIKRVHRKKGWRDNLLKTTRMTYSYKIIRNTVKIPV